MNTEVQELAVREENRGKRLRRSVVEKEGGGGGEKEGFERGASRGEFSLALQKATPRL